MSARDFLARIPHLAVGEVLRVAVPASGDVSPHLNFLVPTACGQHRRKRPRPGVQPPTGT